MGPVVGVDRGWIGVQWIVVRRIGDFDGRVWLLASVGGGVVVVVVGIVKMTRADHQIVVIVLDGYPLRP